MMKQVCQIILITACCIALPFPSNAQTNYSGKLGFAFSPQGHNVNFDSTAVFLDEVSNICDTGVVMANSLWRDNVNLSGHMPGLQSTIGQLKSNFGYIDMLNFGWHADSMELYVPADPTNNWTNASARSLYLTMLDSVVNILQPGYLFLGNEINFYWEEDSADYLNFVNFYHQAYDSIKSWNPNIKVGIVLHYEHLAGLGKLIPNYTQQPYWNALTSFDSSRIDVLGLTVYPYFSYQTADSVPDGYLDPLFNRWSNKPVTINETGWPADSFIGTWTASEAQQVTYANRFFDMIDGENVEVVNWLFLHYMLDSTNTVANRLFRSVSLRDSSGNNYPVYDPWMSSKQPGANFSYAQNGYTISFSDSSTLNTTSWQWLFGDSTSQMTQNPVHIYQDTGTYQVCLIAANNCGTDTSCQTLSIASTGTKGAGRIRNKISVYPNPSSEYLHVVTTGMSVTKMLLQDVQGRSVKQFEIHGDGKENVLNVKDLKKGIYFLRIVADNQRMYKKVILQ